MASGMAVLSSYEGRKFEIFPTKKGTLCSSASIVPAESVPLTLLRGEVGWGAWNASQSSSSASVKLKKFVV